MWGEDLWENALQKIDEKKESSTSILEPNPYPLNKTFSFIPETIERWLEQQKTKPHLMNLVNRDALDFVVHLSRAYSGMSQSSLNLYNHIVTAPNPIVADFRKGAATVLAPLNTLLLSSQSNITIESIQKFWGQVDSGDSVHKALADIYEISPITIRQALHKKDIFSSHLQMQEKKKFLKTLDQTPLSLWPISMRDVSFLEHMSVYTQICEKYMGQNASSVLKKVATSPPPANPANRWKAAFDRLVKEKYVTLLSPHNKSQDQEQALLNHFNAVAQNVMDMRENMQADLLYPLFVLALEKEGYTMMGRRSVTNRSALVLPCSAKIWARSSVREQLAASAYWHSHRVNFQQRLKNAGLISPDTKWPTLLSEDITLKHREHTVLFHCLASDQELRQEHDSMSHCIHTYSQRCLLSGYHVLTMNDQKQNIRSTLTLISESDQVRYNNNKLSNNRTPPSSFTDVAHELVQKINDGSIAVNWQKIQTHRNISLQNDLASSIGYDFRNPEQLARIFAVYRPLLPRHVPLEAKNNPIVFTQWVDIPKVINDVTSLDRESQRNMNIFSLSSQPI